MMVTVRVHIIVRVRVHMIARVRVHIIVRVRVHVIARVRVHIVARVRIHVTAGLVPGTPPCTHATCSHAVQGGMGPAGVGTGPDVCRAKARSAKRDRGKQREKEGLRPAAATLTRHRHNFFLRRKG